MNAKTAEKLFTFVLGCKKNARIKLLGDSITHGVGGTGWEQKGEVIVEGWAQSPDGHGWANLFRDYVSQKYGATVINKACTGTNVEFIINNFSKLVDEEDDIVLCTIGTNNRQQHFCEGDKKSREVLLNTFYENVKKLYRLFQESGIPVVFMANIPASEENEQDGVDYWRILHMCDIRDVYQKVAQECGATVISLYDRFIEYCCTNDVTVGSLRIDGLHPNDEGYTVVYNLILTALAL